MDNWNMGRASCVRRCRSIPAISFRVVLLGGSLLFAVAPGVGQDEDDYRGIGFCAGYFSKELKATKSSASKTSIATLRTESEWYNAKLASLPLSPLKKANALDFGAQTYSLDVQRSGGPPTEQVWRAQRHTECAEMAVKLFPAEASCFERSGGTSVFVCKAPENSSPNHEITRNPMPGTAPPQGNRSSSLSAVPGSPTAVYQEFLNLLNKGQWSKMFDMFDPDSQHRFGTEMRQFISDNAPEAAEQASSASDREIFEMVFKTAKDRGEIRIIAEHITGDVAILDTKIRKNNTWYDADPPVELHRMNGKWVLYWP